MKTGVVQVGGKSTGQNYQVDYDGSYSRSHGTDYRENLELLIRGVNYRVDRTNALHFPAFTLYGPDRVSKEHHRFRLQYREHRWQWA